MPFFYCFLTTLCTNCAVGYISNGATGCMEDCTGGQKINGICTKTDSSCSGNWREATEAEICSFLNNASFPYSAVTVSGSKKLTTCAGAGFKANDSQYCTVYNKGYSDCYDFYCSGGYAEQCLYYSGSISDCGSVCVGLGPRDCVETCLTCTQYRTECTRFDYSKCLNEQYYPGYDSYTSAVAYNCTYTYGYVANSTNKLCIKN